MYLAVLSEWKNSVEDCFGVVFRLRVLRWRCSSGSVRRCLKTHLLAGGAGCRCRRSSRAVARTGSRSCWAAPGTDESRWTPFGVILPVDCPTWTGANESPDADGPVPFLQQLSNSGLAAWNPPRKLLIYIPVVVVSSAVRSGVGRCIVALVSWGIVPPGGFPNLDGSVGFPTTFATGHLRNDRESFWGGGGEFDLFNEERSSYCVEATFIVRALST